MSNVSNVFSMMAAHFPGGWFPGMRSSTFIPHPIKQAPRGPKPEVNKVQARRLRQQAKLNKGKT